MLPANSLSVLPSRVDGGGEVAGTDRHEPDLPHDTAGFAVAGADPDRFFALALDLMVIANEEGHFVRVNPTFSQTLGYPAAELLARPFTDFIHPDDIQPTLDTYAAQSAGNDVVGFENRYRCKDGSYRWLWWRATAVEDGHIYATARDVTERKRAEERVAYLAAVVESTHDAIIGMTPDGTMNSWNPGAERLYGYSADEVKGKPVSILVAPWRENEVPDILRRVRLGERIDNYETVRVRKDGTEVHVSLTIAPIRDSESNVIGVSTIARDITKQRRYQEQLRHLAEHDPLTGARNRRRFDHDLSSQIGRCRRYGEKAALLIIDLECFKQVNDRYGHAAGDRALKATVVALQRGSRETDVVARIGGDEFAVLLPYADEQQAALVATHLRSAIAENVVEIPGGGRLMLDASIGVAIIEQQADSDAIFAEADRNMYRDKQQRRQRTQP
jgi:diguanylate cyclase (GGDEF)-like protein/PAS domain S-box-containing protein